MTFSRMALKSANVHKSSGENILDASSHRCNDGDGGTEPDLELFFRDILPRHKRQRDWIVMAHAVRYFGDDSGSHRQGALVISGYLATEENWARFSRDWISALHQTPEVEFFHMGPNYHGDKRPFKGWTDDDRLLKRSQMLSVLEAYGEGIVELSSSLLWEDYESSITQAVREVFPDPYFFCFHGVVTLVKEWLEKTNEEVHVSYTFDREAAKETRLFDQFFLTERQYPALKPFLGGLCFEDDEYLPGLQAADIIAWLFRRDIVKPIEDAGQMRPELVQLRKSYKHVAMTKRCRKEGIAAFCSRMERDIKKRARIGMPDSEPSYPLYR